MSERDKPGQRVGNARIRAQHSSEGEQESAGNSSSAQARSPFPESKDDPEVWKGGSARSASQASRSQRKRPFDDRVQGKRAATAAPPLASQIGGARAQARPTPPVGATRPAALSSEMQSLGQSAEGREPPPLGRSPRPNAKPLFGDDASGSAQPKERAAIEERDLGLAKGFDQQSRTQAVPAEHGISVTGRAGLVGEAHAGEGVSVAGPPGLLRGGKTETKKKAPPFISPEDVGLAQGIPLPGKGKSVLPTAAEIGPPGTSDGSERSAWAKPVPKKVEGQGPVWAARGPVALSSFLAKGKPNEVAAVTLLRAIMGYARSERRTVEQTPATEPLAASPPNTPPAAQAVDTSVSKRVYPKVRKNMSTTWTTAEASTTARRQAAPALDSPVAGMSDATAEADVTPQQPGVTMRRGKPDVALGVSDASFGDTNGDVSTMNDLATRKASAPPPLSVTERAQELPGRQTSYKSNDRAAILGSQNKLAAEDDPEPRKNVSPERRPPSRWYGSLGYAMQFMIDDAMHPKRHTKIADEYIARNKSLQELGAELAELHRNHPLDYPSLQDIVDIMRYTAGHIAGYYGRQRRALGFDTTKTFHEVGLLHNYQAFNAARDRINDLLKEGSLEPEEIALLTDPRSQVTEDRWKNIRDKQLRKDLQIVTQPSTLYRDTGPDPGRQIHSYIAPDGVRPDIIRVLTKKGEDEMPYLIKALGHIIKGPNKRRNIQDFERWVNDQVDYKNGEQITALEALDRFCQRLAKGDAYVIVDEIKTHPGDFSRYHSEIDFALGHIPEPGTSLIDTNLGADISGTTHALVHLMQNALGYDDRMIRLLRRYMKAEFTEISLKMLHEKTPDTVHAGARHLVIPVPSFRTYSVSLEELIHGWRRRENSIKNQGRIATTGTIYILPFIS